MNIDDDRFQRDEDLLRRILRDEADRVLPSVDALARIRRRTARPPLWRRPVVLGMAAASVTAAAVIAAGAAWMGGSAEDTTATGGDSSPRMSPTTPPTVVPTSPTAPASPDSPPPTESQSPAVGSKTVPVYYVIDKPRERLAREFRRLPVPDGPLVAAVAAMLSEPPLDPDYQTFWSSATEVRDVEVTDEVIEVDFTGETDYTGVLDDYATLAVQQLVYTVTAAAAAAGENGSLPVQILVDGEPAEAMWGGLNLSEPVSRADPLATRLPVQINDPAQNAVVGRSVMVRGEAAPAFEGHLNWEVRDDEGDVVQNDYQTLESGVFREFRFTVELDPGSYTIVVSDTDPSGGAEGFGPWQDTKDFTVR